MSKYNLDVKESLEWFNKFYEENKEFVDIIVNMRKSKIIKKEIPDVISFIAHSVNEDVETKKIVGCQIKGYTKFDWSNLQKTIEYISCSNFYNNISTCHTITGLYPGVTTIGKKQYVEEEDLKRLSDIFRKLSYEKRIYDELIKK